jgi:N,N'-diacetyllegionaminate synthase
MFNPATATEAAQLMIIAEIGVNHDGSVDKAVNMVNSASAAGADAVKLQLFDPKHLLSNQAALAKYQLEPWQDPDEPAHDEPDESIPPKKPEDLRALLKRLMLNIDDVLDVREEADVDHLKFVCTPFSLEDIEPLRTLAVDAVKIASPDAVNHPLLEAAATLGKPMLVSTGGCDIDELQFVADLLKAHEPGGCLMQCVSSYPTPEADAALGGIKVLADRFGLPVGYSDHTMEITTGAMAVAAGACVLEKHFTFNRDSDGPDHFLSLDPVHFTHYSHMARQSAMMVGPLEKKPLEIEADVRRLSRQSLCAARDLKAGQVLTADDITIKRPGTGVPAAQLNKVIGQTLACDVAVNDLINLADLAD